MAKDCIICGKRAGSKEHIFPATLGGRRTNKGIYCGTHNEGFSPLAGILSTQLKAINALLAVRPDHSDKPTFFVFDAEDGNNYSMSGSSIEYAQPKILDDTINGEIRNCTIRFSNQQQLDKWTEKQRAAGVSFNIQSIDKGNRYFTEQLPIKIILGGAEGLRAIGYVALTFLAHDFPEIVRQASLSDFKSFVQGDGPDEFVWWENDEVLSALPSNPYQFGHTIAVCVSADRGEAFARISLFSTLNFSIHFGRVISDSNKAVVTFIDPLAECPPDDSQKETLDQLPFEVSRPENLSAKLGEMIKNGEAQRRFKVLFDKIFRLRDEEEFKPIYDYIVGLDASGADILDDGVKQVVDKQGQRVFILMQTIVKGFKAKFAADKFCEPLIPVLEGFVSPDANSENGISSDSNRVLELCKVAISQAVKDELSKGSLTFDGFSMLLGGGPGAAVVGKVLFDLSMEIAFPTR